jgi:hypothetical protein
MKRAIYLRRGGAGLCLQVFIGDLELSVLSSVSSSFSADNGEKMGEAEPNSAEATVARLGMFELPRFFGSCDAICPISVPGAV